MAGAARRHLRLLLLVTAAPARALSMRSTGASPSTSSFTATGVSAATTPSHAKRKRTNDTTQRKLAADDAPAAADDTPAAPIETSTDKLARKGSFPPRWDPSVPTHTLLLGTQPSDNSLQFGQYFMTNENAFWHIVGDALGFRRGFFVGQRTGAPDFIRPHLLHAEELSYDEAMARLLSRGYAMWDIVASSVRPGSLDSDIKDATYADIAGFVTSHAPVLERIVFSTGAGSANIFLKAHRKSDLSGRSGCIFSSGVAYENASEAIINSHEEAII